MKRRGRKGRKRRNVKEGIVGSWSFRGDFLKKRGE